jgi:hypothetical protein
MPRQSPRATGVAGSAPPPFDDVRVGDAAGEFRLIRRGGHRAWAYVVVAFALEICFVSFDIHDLLQHTRAAHNPDATVLLSAAAGIALSLWVYNDRWRCIEAFSSRFCFGSGWVAALLTSHLCMIWVPSIAFVYANYRGLRKLLGS